MFNSNIVEIYVDLKKKRLEATNAEDVVTHISYSESNWDQLKEILESLSNDSNEIAGEPMIIYFFKDLPFSNLMVIIKAIKMGMKLDIPTEG